MLSGIAADISRAFLFAVALTISLLFPALGYFPLFIMLLCGFAQGMFARILDATSAWSKRPTTR